VKIIETLWFSGMKGTVGLVIIEEDYTHDRKGYIGVVDGQSEAVDSEELVAFGSKFSLRAAEYIAKKLTRPQGQPVGEKEETPPAETSVPAEPKTPLSDKDAVKEPVPVGVGDKEKLKGGDENC